MATGGGSSRRGATLQPGAEHGGSHILLSFGKAFDIKVSPEATISMLSRTHHVCMLSFSLERHL